MFICRWRRALFTKKRINFTSSGVVYDGLPHVASLQDGTWVYSRMSVLRSTPKEVVFQDGSRVKSATSGHFNADVAGRRVVIQRSDGTIYSSGSDDPGHGMSRINID